jgi:hypothetical protein
MDAAMNAKTGVSICVNSTKNGWKYHNMKHHKTK